MKLPQKMPWDAASTTWASAIEPVINRSQNSSLILKNVALASGNNVVNHLLGHKLAGWKIVRLRALATIYDLQDQNPTPTLTLVLVASAPVVVDLEVF